MMRRNFTFFSLRSLVLLLAAIATACLAPAQMVPVPIVSAVEGIPASSYNGTTAGTNCTTGLLGSSTNGDGCPATQVTLFDPYGVAADSYGNLAVAVYGNGAYTTTGSDEGVNVVYEGGSMMAAALIAAKPSYTFTPTVGHVYYLANYSTASSLTSHSGIYYCNNTSSTGGTALNQYGDNCPAQDAVAVPRSVAFDADGNIFIGEVYPQQVVRVIYVGGTRAANLIKAYNPTVTAPKAGYIYSLSAPGDFISIRGIAVGTVNSTTEAVYASDSGTSTAETGLDATTSGNQIKEFVCPTGTTGCVTTYPAYTGNTSTAAGWVTYIGGTTTAGSTSAYGDNGPLVSALVDDPYNLITDKYGNLYIDDEGDDKIRVVYNGGTMPPVYVGTSATPTIVSSPTLGYIYTVVGGGGSTDVHSPDPAGYVDQNYTHRMGIDPQGNLYYTDAHNILWEESAVTGYSVWIGGAGASSTYGTASTSGATSGSYCNGLGTGPTMSDAYGDGCPAMEVYPIGASGPFAFDPFGNFYGVEQRQSADAVGIVRKYSYGNQFGSVAVGSSATSLLAFTPDVNRSGITYATTTASWSLTGGATETDFADAGTPADVCSDDTATIYGTYSVVTCTYTAKFTPTAVGTRQGSLTLTYSGTAQITAMLSGTGTGAQIAVDPAVQSSIGTGLSPAGVAVDQNGDLFISNTTTNAVFKSTAGAAPTSLATGFSSPAQLAVNGSGTIYVADKGNNRIASVTSTGAVSSLLLSTFTLSNGTSTSLSSPSGVAVDSSGNIYVADTGNARVLEMAPEINITASVNGTSATTVAGVSRPSLLGFSGLVSPEGLAVDASGDVFVADSSLPGVVELTPAGVQTAITVSPALSAPVGVALDAAGNLYIADSGNQNVVLVPSGSTTAITVLSSTAGLTGIASDGVGNLYVSSSASTGLIKLNRTNTSVTYPSTTAVGGFSSPVTLTLTNTGNLNLTTGSPLMANTDTTDFAVAPATTNGCSASSTLTPGENCYLTATFQPQAVGSDTDTLSFPSTNAIDSAVVTLNGVAGKIGLTYSIGQPGSVANTMSTTLTATVSPSMGSSVINTGSVSFVIDGGTAVSESISAGTASLTTPLTAGSHTVVATYVGSGLSNTITFSVVTGFASVELTASPSTTIAFGNAVVVTAATTTSNSTATPTGKVTFLVNGVAQTPQTYAASVPATFNLPAGTYVIAADYSGDANYVPASSSITVTVNRATSIVALQATPNIVSTGNTITLTATISPTNTPVATGSITFSYGSTSLGTVTLVSGAASYTTTTSSLSSYVFTAAYTGDTNYSPATVTVTPSPTFVATNTTSTLSVPQNAVGAVSISLSSFYNYTGSITFSCTGLPANSECAGLPNTIVLSANAVQTAQVQIATNTSPIATASANQRRYGNIRMAVGMAGLLLCLSFSAIIRCRRLGQLLLSALILVVAGSFSGCASDTQNFNIYVTPAGTYTVNIVATDGTNTSTAPLTLTVLTSTSAARPN